MARECVNEYLETVGGQIRWRRARRVLLRELSDHIADQAKVGIQRPERIRKDLNLCSNRVNITPT